MVSSGPTLVSIEVFKILFFRRAFVTFFMGASPGHTSFKIERSLPKSIYKHSEARNDKYPRLFYTGVLPQNGLTLLLNLQTEFLVILWNKRAFCETFAKKSIIAQFFLAVALKDCGYHRSARVAHSSFTCDPVYLWKIKQTSGCRIRETEDWGEFNISWELYTVLYREILIFLRSIWREYSCICSHYVFKSHTVSLCFTLKSVKQWPWEIWVRATCFVLPLSTLKIPSFKDSPF